MRYLLSTDKEENMDKNTWFTCNIKGDIGVHDVTKAKAEADLEWNRKNYPNEEWEMFNTEEEDEDI